MRRRLALLSLATTTLVVVALLVPLGLLVRRQAEDRARVAAEREAQAMAGLMALAFDAPTEEIPGFLPPLEEGHVLVLRDGTTLGEPLPGQGTLVADARTSQATITRVVEGGWEVALPVIGREGVAVVDVFVTDDDLTQGVGEAWALLAALGVVLIGAAVWVADRLGVSLVAGIGGLAQAAHRMSGGDLETRVEPADPPEIREVGEAFNQLAERLDLLLVEERETVADLSHRLRTPLTSLRLQAEKIHDPRDRQDVLGHLARLEQSVDRLIVSARRGHASPGIACSLDTVVEDRAAFWRVLADEQEREMRVATDAAGVVVPIPGEDVAAAVDSLVDNVFAHTPPGAGFELRTGVDDGRAWLAVADEGAGFAHPSLVGRGRSGRGSTGLGLDIVRRTAELVEGSLDIDDRPGGGAVIRVWFGPHPAR